MMRMVSARLRVFPLRLSTPRMRVLVGVPSIPPDGLSSALWADSVIFPFASPTALFSAW